MGLSCSFCRINSVPFFAYNEVATRCYLKCIYVPLTAFIIIFGCFAPVSARCEEPEYTVQKKVIKRTVKPIESNSPGKSIVRNPKGQLKSNYPYSERSFSNPQTKAATSAELRRRFEEAFGPSSIENTGQISTNGVPIDKAFDAK